MNAESDGSDEAGWGLSDDEDAVPLRSKSAAEPTLLDSLLDRTFGPPEVLGGDATAATATVRPEIEAAVGDLHGRVGKVEISVDELRTAIRSTTPPVPVPKMLAGAPTAAAAAPKMLAGAPAAAAAPAPEKKDEHIIIPTEVEMNEPGRASPRDREALIDDLANELLKFL
jgi:hypothetical protein